MVEDELIARLEKAHPLPSQDRSELKHNIEAAINVLMGFEAKNFDWDFCKTNLMGFLNAALAQADRLPPSQEVRRPFDKVPITGPGVDALERRKEHGSLVDQEPLADENVRKLLQKTSQETRVEAAARAIMFKYKTCDSTIWVAEAAKAALAAADRVPPGKGERTEIDDWRQAAKAEAGLRREFLARAEKAEAEVEQLRSVSPGKGEGWRTDFENAPKDYMLVGWRGNPAVNRLHRLLTGQWTDGFGQQYAPPTHYQPLPAPPPASDAT